MKIGPKDKNQGQRNFCKKYDREEYQGNKNRDKANTRLPQ